MDKKYVYGLKCPIDNVIRYVGASVNPQKRLSAHWSLSAPKYGIDILKLYEFKDLTPSSQKAKWLAHLRSRGLKPELVLFTQSATEHWKTLEKFHCDKLINSDIDLYQAQHLAGTQAGKSSHIRKVKTHQQNT